VKGAWGFVAAGTALVMLAACSSEATKGSKAATAGTEPLAVNAAPTTTAAVAGSTTTAPRGTTTTPKPGDVAAATASLSAYLGGLAANESGSVLSRSTKAAAALGTVRLLVAEINKADGATTTVTTTRPSFTPTSVNPATVVFGGTVQLSTEVAGPKGTQHSTDTISGPITVVPVNGAWLVSDFLYDGKTMHVESENASQAQGGLHLTVAFVLSYADATAAILGLAADTGNAHVALQRATLTTETGAADAAASAFTAAAKPTGFVRFPRTDGVPVRFDATFTRDGGPAVTFSVPLTGRPG
jgi:hypothetical protein